MSRYEKENKTLLQVNNTTPNALSLYKAIAEILLATCPALKVLAGVSDSL